MICFCKIQLGYAECSAGFCLFSSEHLYNVITLFVVGVFIEGCVVFWISGGFVAYVKEAATLYRLRTELSCWHTPLPPPCCSTRFRVKKVTVLLKATVYGIGVAWLITWGVCLCVCVCVGGGAKSTTFHFFSVFTPLKYSFYTYFYFFNFPSSTQ